MSLVLREFVFSEHAVLNFRELTNIVSLPPIFLIIPPWIIIMVFDHLFVVYDPFLVFVNDVHNLNVIRDKRARKVYGSGKLRNRTKLLFSYPKAFSTSSYHRHHSSLVIVFSAYFLVLINIRYRTTIDDHNTTNLCVQITHMHTRM